MAQAKGSNQDPPSGNTERGGRPRGPRRKRPMLNLGMPFFPIDDFVNQSEDAVALGYRVLEETIEEIKSGYQDARDFNKEQREYEEKRKAYEDKGRKGPEPPPPSVPWEQMVERVQNLQTIAFQAVQDGTELFFDSIRSGTGSTKRLARTWEQSRADVEGKPTLAGPVFEDPIEITALRENVVLVERAIRHKGLTRLRIDAVLDPPQMAIRLPDAPSGMPPHEQAPLRTDITDIKVSFEPARDKETYDDATSLLTVKLGPIPENQAAGIYEGFIRASNFELLIARLRVRVAKAGESSSAEAGA